MPKDLYNVLKLITDGASFDQIEDFIEKYRKVHFQKGDSSIAESAPDWQSEIGGLSYAKEKIDEMFGVAQKYSIFFKGQRVS